MAFVFLRLQAKKMGLLGTGKIKEKLKFKGAEETAGLRRMSHNMSANMKIASIQFEPLTGQS